MAGTGVGKFSSTASNNTSNLTVNFAENMAPSNVNNAARELMGHMRDMYEQLGDGYFEFGDGDGEYTVTRSDANTITITGTGDITSVYYVGRKIRITDGGANVLEGVINASSHSSTTQTIDLTGIDLASGTPTKVELGIDTAAFGGKVILDDDGDTYIEAPTDDTIDIYVAGAKDFVITANTFTAESGSTIAAQALTATTVTASGEIDGGSLDISGDADIDGTTNLDIVDIDGAVDMATTLTLAGNADFNGDLDVDGTTNLDVVDIDGAVDMASTLLVSGSITTSSAMTITTTGNETTLEMISTDADANSGPRLSMNRQSGSPADGDDLGKIFFFGKNDAAEDQGYAEIMAEISDASDGTEDGRLVINMRQAGATTEAIRFEGSNGVVVNEGSADVDFRVESNNGTHRFFVDGGNNVVIVGGNDGSGTVPVPTNCAGGLDPVFQLQGANNANEFSMHISAGINSAGSPPRIVMSKSRDNTLNGNTIIQDDDVLGAITFTGADGVDRNSIAAEITAVVDGNPGENDMPGRLLFLTTSEGQSTTTERMRIVNDGHVHISRTVEGASIVGISLREDGIIKNVVDGNVLFSMNRLSDDGNLVAFQQAGSEEGTISVSGTTVSYNGFTGSHWSRLADNSKPTILRGTIMDSIDEMCDWYQAVADVAEVNYTAEDEKVIHGDKNVGDVKTEAHKIIEEIALPSDKSVGDAVTFTSNGVEYTGKYVKEGDVKHVKSKVSDTADSTKIYGVFSHWDEEGVDTVNDMFVSQVGTYIIRVHKDVTVSAGDLLVSNGDGTAKKQDDDIIRSKTVAKVNSNIKVETYADGSYTVPCTLHC